MPKVSVIIPTYNRAWCLRNAIESVLAQTFQDLELLVIDDGSTDETVEVLASFPGIEYYRQGNRGVSAARNTGVAHTQGEYIVFLDSDDILMEHALQIGVDTLDKNPQVGFCYGQFYIMDEAGQVLGLRRSSMLNCSSTIDGREQIRELLYTDRIRLSAMMSRRHVLKEAGLFNEDMRNIAEDLDLIVRMAKICDVAYIGQPIAKLRRHSGCLSLNYNGRSAEKAYLAVLREIFQDPLLGCQFQPLRRMAQFNFYRIIALYSYGNDMKLSRRYLKKALSVYPRSLLEPKGLELIYIYVKSMPPAWARELLRKIRSRLLRKVAYQAENPVTTKPKLVQHCNVEKGKHAKS